jgi:IS5 family transposase
LAQCWRDCISKGKARTPYEFGVKVGIASTHKGNLIVGAWAFHGHPYDGHTLHEQLEQATIRMQDSAVEPATVFVDLGYRGVDTQNPDVRIVHRGKTQRISKQESKLLRPRKHRAHPLSCACCGRPRLGRYRSGQARCTQNWGSGEDFWGD